MQKHYLHRVPKEGFRGLGFLDFGVQALRFKGLRSERETKPKPAHALLGLRMQGNPLNP